MIEQLPLPLKLFDDATFKNYIAGEQHEVVSHLQRFVNSVLTSASEPTSQPEHFIYLWGGKGSGKSHLLQACYHEALQNKRTAFYLSLNDYRQLNSDVFEGLEQMDLICLDDIEAIANDTNWQQALFHLYNRIRDNNKLLIVSSKQSSSKSDFKLADLQSRLSWGVTFHLSELADAEKEQALKLHAKIRGINLTAAVLQYIFKNYSRNMHDLLELLAKLEQRSLIEKRRVTVPFLKTVI